MRNALGGLSAVLVMGLLLSGCHESATPPAPQPETGRVVLRFTYEDLDSQPFSLDSAYLTASDDVVTINRLKYYLSSVRLRRADSSEWQAPDAAFLVDALHRDTLSLRGVPPGDYVSLAFDIGLDSVTNSRLDHGGDLAPSKEMQWSWSTGYKFLSLDGQWWQGAQAAGIVEYHIGRAPTLRTVRRNLSRAVHLTGGTTSTVQLTVRPQVVFGGPNVMLLSDSHNRNVMFDTPQAMAAADNYVTMFGSARVE
jgi:hypothetical protein